MLFDDAVFVEEPVMTEDEPTSVLQLVFSFVFSFVENAVNCAELL